MTDRLQTRRLRFFLRDFRMVEASANIPDGQALAAYLARRRNWITLLDAHWIGTGETAPVVVLRLQQIQWVESRESGVPAAVPASASRPREVELRLEGGLVVRGQLPIHEGQRLADYLEAAGPFVPLMRAFLMRSGRPPRATNVVLRDVDIHRDVIQTVAEADEVSPVDPDAAAPVAAAADGRRPGT